MRRHNVKICFHGLILLIGVWLVQPLHAQEMSSSFQSGGWRQIGLEKVWSQYVGTLTSPGGQPRVVMHASREKVNLAYEVVHAGGSDLFIPQQLDRFGRRLTEQSAATQADIQQRILETKQIESEIVIHRTPRVTIHTQSADGTLRTIDAETGELRWSIPIGDRQMPSSSPTANDQYVAVLNGARLYVVDVETGKLEFDRSTISAYSIAPAISKELIYAPMISGRIETYPLAADLRNRSIRQIVPAGRTFVRPLVTPHSVCWPTERGYLYVANADTTDIRYRMEARSRIPGQAAYLAPNQLFAASAYGYLFAIEEDTGRIQWQYSSGESFSSSPIAVGQQVFIASDNGMLLAVNAQSGSEEWGAPGVKKIVSIGDKRLYAVGTDGRLLAIDRNSGAVMGAVALGGRERFIANNVSDRVYFLTRDRELICLRDQQSLWPTIHVDVASEDQATPDTESSTSSDASGENADASLDSDADSPDQSGSLDEGGDTWGDDQPTDAPDDEGLPGFGDEDDIFGDDGSDF